MLKKFNQDKIEFAIEKMVELGEHFRNTSKDTNGHMKSADLVKYINQQIEELKEE